MRRILLVAAMLLAGLSFAPTNVKAQDRATASVNVTVVIPPVSVIRTIDTRPVPTAGPATFETTVNVDSNTSYALEFRNTSEYTIAVLSAGGRVLAPGQAHTVYVRHVPGNKTATKVVWRVEDAASGAEVPLTIMLAPSPGA